MYFQPICSGSDRGQCVCGKCDCKAEYIGEFCENCPVSICQIRIYDYLQIVINKLISLSFCHLSFVTYSVTSSRGIITDLEINST